MRNNLTRTVSKIFYSKIYLKSRETRAIDDINIQATSNIFPRTQFLKSFEKGSVYAWLKLI